MKVCPNIPSSHMMTRMTTMTLSKFMTASKEVHRYQVRIRISYFFSY